jgi:hypothetical protein
MDINGCRRSTSRQSLSSAQSVQSAAPSSTLYATQKRQIHEINLHDLRHLEYQLSPHEEPKILIRRHAVLVSLNPLRAVVLADKMLLIVPDGAETLLSMLYNYIKGEGHMCV